MERTKMAAGDETVEFRFDGKTVKVVTRAPEGGQLTRLFELSASPKWDDSSPMSDKEVTAVVRGLIETAREQGEQAEVVGVPPAAAMWFPGDTHVFVAPLEPVSFSLPGSPTGLILKMDERGDGRLWALGSDRVDLGRDGMWWIVRAIIDALVDPVTTSQWPRFLVLGTSLGGPATQASLETGDWGVGIVWRKLENGVVGDVVAVQELTYERVDGWLRLLRPVRDELERRRAHRQRLRPARQAEKWVRALERWAAD